MRYARRLGLDPSVLLHWDVVRDLGPVAGPKHSDTTVYTSVFQSVNLQVASSVSTQKSAFDWFTTGLTSKHSANSP